MTKAAGKALASLRHLAMLGLPPAMVFDEAARCLSELARFESATLVLYDDDFSATDAFLTHEISPAVANRYFERWFNREEARFIPSHAAVARGGGPDVFRVSDATPKLWETELYDEVFGELGFYRMASVMLREGGRVTGNISIGRPPGGGDFSDRDLAALREAMTFASLALSPRTAPAALVESSAFDEVETAVVVTDAAGSVQHLSHNAWRLLRWASMAHHDAAVVRECLDAPAAHHDAYGWARPLLKDLADRVAANLHGACAAPPLLRRRSRHGEFVLKAFAMHAGVAAAGAIVVQVQRRTPVDARLFRSELFRSLTAQEQIVCRLLIKGSTQGDIARSLGVSPHTVVSHIRNIYRRTGANDRDSLKGVVLPLAEAA